MTNQELKLISNLKQKKYRKKHGTFIIEGKRLITAAVDYKANITTIYTTELFQKSNMELIIKLEKSKLTIKTIPSKQLDKMALTKTPSGITAICKIPTKKNLDLEQKKWLYLDNISDPGNMGTILRSAGWFNYKHIAISSKSVDVYSPKVVRAGMGAHFGLSIYAGIDLSIFSSTHHLFGADKEGKKTTEIDHPEKLVLVLGNEAHGLSKNSRELLNKYVSIDKIGFGESLNVSAAAAILMNHFSKN
jgi:TrmH family RNA methyltransferase